MSKYHPNIYPNNLFMKVNILNGVFVQGLLVSCFLKSVTVVYYNFLMLYESGIVFFIVLLLLTRILVNMQTRFDKKYSKLFFVQYIGHLFLF